MIKLFIFVLLMAMSADATSYYLHLGNPAGDTSGVSTAHCWGTFPQAKTGYNGTAPEGGDIIYVRGSRTFTDVEDTLNTAGSSSTGWIKWIGVNASWENDGSRAFVITENGSVSTALRINAEYNWIENFEIVGGDFLGLTNEAAYTVIKNCSVHGAGLDGIYSGSGTSLTVIRSKLYDNGRYGAFIASYSILTRDTIITNTQSGLYIDGTSQNTIENCIIHDNGDGYPAIAAVGIGSKIRNNVIDGTGSANDTGIIVASTAMDVKIYNNRVTNFVVGIKGDANYFKWEYNYFHGNTADTLTCKTEDIGNGGTNKFDVDADDGYTDVGTHDFSIKASRTYNGQE